MNHYQTNHYWNSVKDELDQKGEQSLWRAHSDEVNRQLIQRWLKANKSGYLLKTDLFDEAVSDGLFTELSYCAKAVVGMDLSSSVVIAAGSHHEGLKTIVGDTRCLPFADDSFDIVVSNSTLDHFASHREIAISLWELQRVLRPGGKLLLTLDNPANPIIALRQLLPFKMLFRLGIVPYYVGATCDREHLSQILEETGFETLDTTAVMHVPRVFAVGLARVFERIHPSAIRRGFLKFLKIFEKLEEWPTRYRTGHFVAVLAAKR